MSQDTDRSGAFPEDGHRDGGRLLPDGQGRSTDDSNNEPEGEESKALLTKPDSKGPLSSERVDMDRVGRLMTRVFDRLSAETSSEEIASSEEGSNRSSLNIAGQQLGEIVGRWLGALTVRAFPDQFEKRESNEH